jgi:hypothetical protein
MVSEVKYGQELGVNLIKIAKKLTQNQDLCMLLINTDLEPLNITTHPDKIKGISLLHKNIRVIPLLTPEEQSTQSKIVLLYDNGELNNFNPDNENLSFIINVYCPFNEWLIAGDTLRPFAIMSEIRKTLQNKRLNGIGEIKYLGFGISTLTDEMGCYRMEFRINAFS